MPHDHPPGCGCGAHRPQADPHALRTGAQVSLTGQLVCRDLAEMMVVLNHAPAHINASRAEPGCRMFDLRQTDDPLVFAFAELFVDEAAYRAHQARTRASDWGAATADIARAARDRRGMAPAD
ncbi:putative quinol monooxygenase [Paracoccus sphaerophysae]|uniref:putative quinol monooxygenase n=1 Tax=Paracoccus sphaerophysae TaxID=690417 RepID=UPI002352D591|nr:antibiotic biosynthesis monooxygenase [Paracoccus sphaerophysae]